VRGPVRLDRGEDRIGPAAPAAVPANGTAASAMVTARRVCMAISWLDPRPGPIMPLISIAARRVTRRAAEPLVRFGGLGGCRIAGRGGRTGGRLYPRLYPVGNNSRFPKQLARIKLFPEPDFALRIGATRAFSGESLSRT
jgi:hypothetical protein